MTGDLHVRRPLRDERHYRRGLYLLPTIYTVGNMFCGYACVIFAMRGELSIAAPFVGVAVVLDMLDGRIARLTKTSSAFGLELDSLADVISFGMAPAMLAFAWGMDVCLQLAIAQRVSATPGLPQDVAGALHDLLQGNLTKVLISMAMWLPYLLLSDRVNVTYRSRVSL